MKLCLCVTGLTGAGKTTLVRQLGLMGWRTCHSGDLFRKHMHSIPDDDDPIAPEFADKIIHDALMATAKEVMDAPGIGLLAVECIPRAVRSVDWVVELRDMGYMVHVLLLSAKKSLRESRVESRDLHDTNRLSIDRRKMVAEQMTDVFFDIRQELEGLEIPVTYCETDEWQYTLNTTAPAFSIDRMLNCAINFYGEKVDYSKELGVPRMLERTFDELAEAKRASDQHGPTSQHLVTELVDALWFLLGAFKAAGVQNGRELVQHYLAKAAINQHRLDSETHMDTNG
jgi:dephospho-CoA kinase